MEDIRELTWIDFLDTDGTVEDVLAKVTRQLVLYKSLPHAHLLNTG